MAKTTLILAVVLKHPAGELHENEPMNVRSRPLRATYERSGFAIQNLENRLWVMLELENWSLWLDNILGMNFDVGDLFQ